MVSGGCATERGCCATAGAGRRKRARRRWRPLFKRAEKESMVSKLKPIVDWYRRQPAFARPESDAALPRKATTPAPRDPSSPANMGERVREPSHAGCGTIADGPTLSRELDAHLAAAGKNPAARALIVPHAGHFTRSRRCLATRTIRTRCPACSSRSSHHVFRAGAPSASATSTAPPSATSASTATPTTSPRDRRVHRHGRRHRRGRAQSRDAPPYIRKVFESRPGGPPPLVPVMVGALTPPPGSSATLRALPRRPPTSSSSPPTPLGPLLRHAGRAKRMAHPSTRPSRRSIGRRCASSRRRRRRVREVPAEKIPFGRHPNGYRASEKSAGFAERIVAFTR